MTRHADPLGVAFVVVAAIGFGTLGPLARFAADAGFSTVSFAVWRAVASAVALAVLLTIGVLAGRLPTTPWSAVPRLERLQLAAMGLLATLLLAEQPSPSQLFGGLLVLAGAALAQLAPGVRSRVEVPLAAE